MRPSGVKRDMGLMNGMFGAVESAVGGAYQSVKDGMEWAAKLSPAELRKLSNARMSDLILKEIARARERAANLEKKYPSATKRELAQRLIDEKKGLAGMVGGISGVFGLASVPADLVVMVWLQINLLVDVATLYKVNLKTERARQELLDLFGYANGVGPLQRAGPKVVGTVAGKLLEKGGMHLFGRAVPLVAAPITAYLNNRHIQDVGESAVKYYEGFHKAQQKTRERKTRRASGQA